MTINVWQWAFGSLEADLNGEVSQHHHRNKTCWTKSAPPDMLAPTLRERAFMAAKKFDPLPHAIRDPASLALVGLYPLVKNSQLRFYWVFEGFVPGNRQKNLSFGKRYYLLPKEENYRQEILSFVKRSLLSPKEENFRGKILSFAKRTYLFPKIPRNRQNFRRIAKKT